MKEFKLQPNERIVLRTSEGYVRWIAWAANISPSIRTSESIKDAEVYKEDYFYVRPHEKVPENRLELILQKYPDLKMLKVKLDVEELIEL